MGRFLKGAFAGGTGAAAVMAASAAIAGTGVGGVFNLGQTNQVGVTTTLTGSATGPQLQVSNGSTGTGATGLGIDVATGKPPLVTNSSTRVANLNADRVDGFEAAQLTRGAMGYALKVSAGGTFVDQTSVTITAPKAGLVLVNSTMALRSSSSQCTPCAVHTRLVEDGTTAQSLANVIRLTTAGGDVGTTDAHTWMFKASAGTHTYELQASVFPLGQVTLWNPVVTALFVPFNGAGVAGGAP